jgi:c-di-GMP-binding flagellar brake protein YcgR
MESKEIKRKFQRVECISDIKVNNIEDDENVFSIVTGKGMNVSACGVLFKYRKKIQTHTTIKLRFLRPDSFEFIEALAEIVRVEKNIDNTFDIGAEFLDMDESKKNELNRYLRKKSRA